MRCGISASCLEISFFSNVNIFVGMLLGSTDLFESSEDIILAHRKKKFRVLFFRNSEKCLCEGLIFYFIFSAIVAK